MTLLLVPERSFCPLMMDPHDELPPPPPLPPNVVPIKAEDAAKESPPNKPTKPTRLPIARPGLGKKGQPIQLLANHFKVSVKSSDDFFHHYHVNLKYEDDQPVEGKGIGRKVIDKLQHTYRSELANKDFAYDGEKSLFTVGSLPQVTNEFTVILEDIGTGKSAANGSPSSPGGGDRKRVRRPYQTKTYKVELCFAAKIPMAAIAMAIRGQESENTLEALRVLDIILRQHSAKQGCLLVRQSSFHNNPASFVDLGGGVMGCRGFHSSFRGTQSGLSLNVDVSTTMIVKPGPVIDFLLANQKVDHPDRIDWPKAKRALKNLRIKAAPGNSEFKVVGLSDRKCNEQTFPWRQRNGNNGDTNIVEITVSDYFLRHKGIELRYSGNFPCIHAGRSKRPTYFPVELCTLVPLQRYTKALSTLQRSSLVEKSRQKPQERMSTLNDALKRSNYDSDPMLMACGISIAPKFTQIEGRVLQAPKLRVGNGEDMLPRNGRWNLANKKFLRTCSVTRWSVVNFSARCDVRGLVRDLKRLGAAKGIEIEEPYTVIEEIPSMRRARVSDRVDKMIAEIKSKLPGLPKFLLCLLPERKNCEVYGPWKRKCLADFGIVTQCLAPTRVNDNYLNNVLLKINAKLGGLNTLLQIEVSRTIPIVSEKPTIILGMDVSHGQPGQSDRPSIAAVVSSREWPLVSRYRATVHTQSPKLEMMSSLFKPDGTADNGLIRESLIDFYTTSEQRKPDNVIIFRDGVSESQFTQVINIELEQIIEACKFLDEKWEPKFTVIVAQKNHHTRFFQTGSPENVPPGTVVDKQVCHPKNFDFYMCAHAGMIGTSRPTHYHVLHDEIGFTADALQEFVHSLSYVYQRSTTAISIVAPISYAHLAAAQVGTFMKFEDMSDVSSSQGGHTSVGSVPVPELPRLHENVRSTMFFC
ncbi:protein argonaute 4B [Lolium perenne]|uniref:protein argonaute 4B n=1 Tax=Lolium perenne TaxID=4522 RepID=UPI0021F68308|nr:protein argonaute 4B-like [Lolium perenne]